MNGTYDAQATLALSRQRGAELRAQADRDRLARSIAPGSAPGTPWWRRWARHALGRPADPQPEQRQVAGPAHPAALRWP
jgi:hypothetical protein